MYCCFHSSVTLYILVKFKVELPIFNTVQEVKYTRITDPQKKLHYKGLQGVRDLIPHSKAEPTSKLNSTSRLCEDGQRLAESYFEYL